MFSDKLSSSTSSFARGPAQLLSGSRSHAQHSRAAEQLRENAGSPAPQIAPITSGGGSKIHTSPSKVRLVREPFIFDPVHVHQSCLLPVSIPCTGITRNLTRNQSSLPGITPCVMSLSHHRHPLSFPFVLL